MGDVEALAHGVDGPGGQDPQRQVHDAEQGTGGQQPDPLATKAGEKVGLAREVRGVGWQSEHLEEGRHQLVSRPAAVRTDELPSRRLA